MTTDQGYLAALTVMPLLQILPHQHREHLPAPLGNVTPELPAILDAATADEYIAHLRATHNNNDFCVLPPLRFDSIASGPLHHLFLCSNTLREALYYLEKFSALLSEHMVVNVTRTRMGPLRVRMDLKAAIENDVSRWRMELLISTLLSWFRHLCGSRLSIERILLPWPEPDYTQRYTQQWQTDLLFNCPQCTIELRPDSLDLGLHHTNPNITQMMRREVEQQFRKLVRAGSLCNHIQRALTSGQLSFSATQQTIAEHFNISTRTLNRHLQREATSLKQLVTRVRIERAKHMLLSSNSSIDDVAVTLGLSGRRALDRIFYKHENISPAQFRQDANTKISEVAN
ncbi:helix-turn-helix domain-containing protein [Candidatus Thalassolituus haligoni]|uniref:AraC family transcriptional regulator n=1 Tax=Candidatus Thalassolituus haligoni TaxID=3100113 RepID=UPI00351939A0|tara:strand:+ start:22947 stop:23975 length:1029 start_codon:yes stop_codon:yes gene_type:complete